MLLNKTDWKKKHYIYMCRIEALYTCGFIIHRAVSLQVIGPDYFVHISDQTCVK